MSEERVLKRPLRYDPVGYNSGPCIRDADGQLVAALFWPVHPFPQTQQAEAEIHLLGSRMVAAANEIDPDDDDVYQIGFRDGYEDAVQDIDLETGGDGEFKGSTLPGGTVDVEVMKGRIIARLQQ